MNEEKECDCYHTNYGILFDLKKDNIEKLLMECRKENLDDTKDFDENSDSKSK